MHIFTTSIRTQKERRDWVSIPDGMVEHDGHVGQLLDKLDKLGIADNTIVMYSTDNGAEAFSGLTAGPTPFRGEKNTKLGRRLPRALRNPVGLALSSRAPSSTESVHTKTCSQR